MKILICVAMSFFVLTGCSAHKMWYGSDKPSMSFVVVDGKGDVQHAFDKNGKPISQGVQGYIITWSPEYNGAFVSSSGKGCIQPAMYATTASGEAAIPTELFTSGLTGSVEGTYAEALDKLISVTDQSTFLSIGMYGICQLAAADALTKAESAALVKLLFEKASKESSVDSQMTTTTEVVVEPEEHEDVSGETVNSGAEEVAPTSPIADEVST